MVTHHHPSSWLVKEEEEESSEPKTWASQARVVEFGRSQGFQGGNRKMIYWRAFKRLCTYKYINYIYIVYYVPCTMYYICICVVYYIIYSIYYIFIHVYIYIVYVLRVFLPMTSLPDFPIYRQILLTHSGAMRCAWQMWLGCFAAWAKSVFGPEKTPRIIGRILQFVKILL